MGIFELNPIYFINSIVVFKICMLVFGKKYKVEHNIG